MSLKHPKPCFDARIHGKNALKIQIVVKKTSKSEERA